MGQDQSGAGAGKLSGVELSCIGHCFVEDAKPPMMMIFICFATTFILYIYYLPCVYLRFCVSHNVLCRF